MNFIENLIDKIAGLQSVNDPRFSTGIFPSYRKNAFLLYNRPDNNLFFTAAAIFTLNSVKASLPPYAINKINDITRKATDSYSVFKNKDGLKTYNFFASNPSKHFPNGYFLKHFNHFSIPDDADCTALAYLTKPHEPEDTIWLKQKLVLHANLSKKQIKNTEPQYRQLKTYSTWFGKNMPIEFDACVLSNILYWIYENNLEINEFDEDSLIYIRSVILSDEYLNEPFSVAPSYPKASLVLYHVARLIGNFDITILNGCKEKLIFDAENLLKNEKIDFMEKVIISTSLERLGRKCENFSILNEKMATENFSFFVAGMLTAYENPSLRKLARNSFFHLNYHCTAHSYALLIENLVFTTL